MIVRSRAVRLDLAGLRPHESIAWELFDGQSIEAVFEPPEITGGGAVWNGRISGEEGGHVMLAVREGVVVGDLQSPSLGTFEIQPVGGGIHALRQLDLQRLPGRCEVVVPVIESSGEESGSRGSTEPAVLADGGGSAAGTPIVAADGGEPTIDVMVVYTPAARSGAGGTAAIQAQIDLAVSQTNTAYANSLVNQRIRLVYRAEVPYTESGSSALDLSRLQNQDGVIDTVLTWRNTYGADVVTMIIETGDNPGVGNLMKPPNSSFAPYAFSAVMRYAATSAYSYSHEVGHNMGCQHDAGHAPQSGAYPYSYGHQFLCNGQAYRTIMAYPPGTRLLHYSNPNVLYQTCPTGVANLADNARSLNNTAPIVAAFRPTAGPVLTSLTVSPSSASITTGGTQQFAAQGFDQFGQPMTATVTWSSTGGTINTSGLYTAGSAAGTYVVTAASGTVSGSASVTLTLPPPVFTSVAVSPGYLPLAPGGTYAFTASGRDQYGNPYPLPGPVSWGSSLGSITSSGIFTAPSASGPYSVTVTAASGGKQGSASIAIQNPSNLLRGDANGSDFVDISDVTYLLTYIFSGGPPPAYLRQGDANGSLFVDISDVTYLLAYIFSGGPPPPP